MAFWGAHKLFLYEFLKSLHLQFDSVSTPDLYQHTFCRSGGTGPVMFYFADQASYMLWNGVASDVQVTCPGGCAMSQQLGKRYSNVGLKSDLGGPENFFIEDSSLTNTTFTNAGYGCIDDWGAGGTVVRYSTFTNCLVSTHGVTHNGGPTNFEVYHTTIGQTMPSQAEGLGGGYRLIHDQGSGTELFFGNTFFKDSGSAWANEIVSTLFYADYAHGPSIDGQYATCDGSQTNRDGNRSPSSTWYGYPCSGQPGRDIATGEYKPMYAWNNKKQDTGSLFSMILNGCCATTGTSVAVGTYPPTNCTAYNGSNGSSANCYYGAAHMALNRELYTSSYGQQSSPTSPFNGTSGVGWGTLANRPTTCTTSSETAYGNGAAGVGYFATDEGPQGTLYTCSATNTWTVYYTPYTYPHPLVSGTSTQPPTNGGSPAPPKNLSVIVQ